MIGRTDFMAAIYAAPDDDVPRLVFADWLQEHGEEERGDFIRVQCEMAAIPIPPDSETIGLRSSVREQKLRALLDWKKRYRKTYYVLRARERELLEAHRYSWTDGLLGPDWKVCGLGDETGSVVVEFTRAGERTGVFALKFSRGFVAEVTCTAEDWLTRHEDLVRCWEKCGTCEGEPLGACSFDSGKTTVYPSCPTCSGKGRVPPTMTCPKCNGLGSPGLARCRKCLDTGRVPRSFTTQQPIRKVTLTTEPNWGMAGWPEYPDEHRLDATSVLLDRWPGIEFVLPP